MDHDLLHIQGKPYVLVPLHEYRTLNNGDDSLTELPQDIQDEIFARREHPVKIIRRHRGMTQAELAEASGLSRPYLTEIETGRKDGTINTMRDIAAALSVPVAALVS